jgi:ubiquinone/menaquinone biosynthesis C-methylase UbiE
MAPASNWGHLPLNKTSTTPDKGDSAGNLLPLLFRSEQSYGWSIGMRNITHTLLTGLALPFGPLVDLGCGGGAMAAELANRFRDRQVFGLDLHPAALHQSGTVRPGRTIQADINRLPLADARVALLLALDSLDQAGVDPARSLAECRRVLKRNGLLILRVSAHAWLEGPHDAAFNTGRRHHQPELAAMLRSQGFHLQRVTYANVLLMPPVVSVRLMQQQGLLPMFEAMKTETALDDLMAGALKAEARWLRRHNLAFGLSLYAIARK